MRLIDADDLIRKLEIFESKKDKKEHYYFSFKGVKELLENAPTAYDLEKIVGQLEEKALEHAINGQQFGADGWDNHANNEYEIRDVYDKAIEIVKSGGKKNEL